MLVKARRIRGQNNEPFKGRAVRPPRCPPVLTTAAHSRSSFRIWKRRSASSVPAFCPMHRDDAPESHKLRVFTSGLKRRIKPTNKRQMRRRPTVEPVIGHLKSEHRMDRNYLAGERDAVNTVLAAAGYNFSLPLRWFRQLFVSVRRTTVHVPGRPTPQQAA